MSIGKYIYYLDFINNTSLTAAIMAHYDLPSDNIIDLIQD